MKLSVLKKEKKLCDHALKSFKETHGDLLASGCEFTHSLLRVMNMYFSYHIQNGDVYRMNI